MCRAPGNRTTHEVLTVNIISEKTLLAERRTLRTVSPLALMLAAGLTGCASNSTRPTASNFTDEGRASMATATIDAGQSRGSFTSDAYVSEGEQIALPQAWVSEARTGVAELEARRAAAQAAEVTAFANYDQYQAASDAVLERGFVARDTGYADAELTRSVHDARLYEFDRNIASREVMADTEFERQESFLSASVKEWQAEVERMRSEAENGWQSSLAEHERMLATRGAVQERGQAEIDRMLRAMDLTQARAVERVQALRTEAQSVAEQSAAEVEQLNQLILTTQAETDASVIELTQKAHSLDDELASRVAELNAQADLLATTDADHLYKLGVESAAVTYETSLAEAEDLRLTAEERSKQNAAKISMMTGDAEARFQSAQTTYEEAQRGIQAQYSKLMADVSKFEAEADEVETIGRSAYLKAEIDARVAALRATADHTRAIADSEQAKIEAEAFAEARKLQAKFAKEFAAQQAKGSVAIPGNTKQTKPGVTAEQESPYFTTASKKPENVLPEHIAAFKSSLAKSTELRQRAEAARFDAVAMRESEMGRFNDWWNQRQAEYRTSMASIDAFSQKANAEVSRMFNRADSMIAEAETQRTRALVEAEASRNEAYARIATLRGNSETLDKKKEAQVRQLLAQAEATRRTGEGKIASLTVQRDSTARRGEAKSKQLMAEASSLETSQRAVVAQMGEDIDAARQILAAELNRLDQGAASFIAVAEANFDEAKALADAFERIAVANAGELTARHLASRKQAEANIGYMRRLAGANELVRDAEVARRYAAADEALGMERARDIARRGNIEAEHQVAMASVNREFAVADAGEAAVRAQFDSRIAQTMSERNRSYADLYRQGEQQRVRSEIAAAEAASYAEMSLAALQRLNSASQSFQNSAQRNWDARLALPGELPAPAGTEDLFDRTNAGFVVPQFVTAPTDTE